MPKLFSSRQIVKLLTDKGFIFISQRGSHAKYRKISLSETLTTIVPMNKKEIPYGTFRSILRQARLDKKDFE